MLEIVAKYSWAWLLPIALLAGATALWLYYYKSPFGKYPRLILALLRFLGLFLLGIFLLEIFVKNISERTQKPLLLWLEDHSPSVVARADSLQVKELYSNDLVALRQKLGERYTIRSLAFAERPDSLIPQKYYGTRTNISEALEIADIRYQNLNIGGMVLVSDGIFNVGYNPQYRARNFNYPVFTVGVGSSDIRRDAALSNLEVNNITYLDNEFPLEINVTAHKLKDETLAVKVLNGSGQTVFQESKKAVGEEAFVKFTARIAAREVGLQRYAVQLQNIDGEVNTDNNRESFVIDVLDNRKEIHLVSDGLHPDVAAVKQALIQNKNYEVRSFLAQNYNAELQAKADLIVAHSPQKSLVEILAESDLPYFVIAGMQSDIRAIEQSMGMQWAGNAENYEEVRPLVNTGFTLFNISSVDLRFFKEQPPVMSPFGKVALPGTQQVLLHKKVGAIATDFALFSMGVDAQNRKIAFFNGEGLWRWRMYNFKKEGHFDNFNRTMLHTAQYLLAGSQRRRFAVKANGSYEEGGDVVVQATLYNASFEPTTQGEVNLQLQNEAAQNFNYGFRKQGDQYSLNLGSLEPGIYRYKATAILGEEKFNRTGDFVVRRNNVETRNLVANHNLLRKIAQATGGQFYKPAQLGALQKALQENPQARSMLKSEVNAANILEWKWLWGLIVLLFAAEWALRKFWGY